jgi:hypothetical protein
VPSTKQIDYSVPCLQVWISDGYLVCATDYQGLGTLGQHQYEINRSQACDAVYLFYTALKKENVGAAAKFGCIGWSQSGGAAGAVAELDHEDYGDLKLVVTVCMSPGSPIVVRHVGHGAQGHSIGSRATSRLSESLPTTKEDRRCC